MPPFALRQTKPEGLRRLNVSQIRPSPYQMRREFDENSIKALAASIRLCGLLQPIAVRPQGGGFELIAGERRWRAVQMLGMKEIDAVVLEISAQESAVLALVENLQREDLHYFDEAEGYARTLQTSGLTQEALARRIGRSQSALANKLRLLNLPENVRKSLRESGLSERHARALLRLTAPHVQLEAVRQAREGNLTVRQLETLVSLLAASPPPEGAKRRILPLVRDGRLYVNAFRHLVDQMGQAGVTAELSVGEEENGIRIGVWIPRSQTPRQVPACLPNGNTCIETKSMI